MRNITYIIIALTLLPGTAISQNNGFLGKHFLLTYNIHTMPRLHIIEMQDMITKSRLDIRHELQLSAIIDRFTTFNLTYQRGNYQALSYEKSLYNTSTSTSRQVRDKVQFMSNAIGGGFSFYNKVGPSALAPVGTYLKLHLLYLTYSMTDEAGAFGYYDYEEIGAPFKQELAGKSIRLGIGYGRTRVIKDHVVLDYGLESEIGLSNDLTHPADRKTYYDYSIYEGAAARGLQARTISLRLGVGGLLF